MSIAIKWQPLANSWRSAGSGSSIMYALERAFGDQPIALNRDAIPVLRGMSALTHDEVFDRLIEAIEQHGEIEVRGES